MNILWIPLVFAWRSYIPRPQCNDAIALRNTAVSHAFEKRGAKLHAAGNTHRLIGLFPIKYGGRFDAIRNEFKNLSVTQFYRSARSIDPNGALV